jgi:uncharacterized protein (DUF302 family)
MKEKSLCLQPRIFLKKVGMGVVFIFGLLVGILLTGSAAWIAMPKMMLVVHKSRYNNVEETCRKLHAAIEAQGWSTPAVRDINKTIEKSGINLSRQVRIVELCKASYAKDVLETNPEVSTLMPCAWGVYQGDDGNVYISGMNMGLMGKIFGGNIAKVMGGPVSADEESILRDIVE